MGGGGVPRPRPAWWIVLWLAAAAIGLGAWPSDAALPLGTSAAASGFDGEDLECDMACQETQKAMLLQLYASTGGRDWTVQQGWEEADTMSHCGFFGVHCCAIDHTIVVKYITVDGWTVTYGNSADSFGKYCPVRNAVAALTLSINNLHGTFPPGFFNVFISGLLYVDFHGNAIRGTIPSEVGSLTMLRELSLHSNAFTGTIPLSIGSLSNLVALNLGGNELVGNIPVTLGNLNKVKHLSLGENMLTGPVPFFLFGIDSLKIVYLHDNHLSGNITDFQLAFVDIELPYLMEGTGIEELYLRKNQLEGTIPSTVTSLPLVIMDLGENLFSGQIPRTVGRSPFLRDLLLDNNLLTGTIPDHISKWSLQVLDLRNNMLTGTIPVSMADLKTLTTLNLANNSLSGSLPDRLMELRRLQTLDISFNSRMIHPTLNSRLERLPAGLAFDALGQFPQVDRVGRSRQMFCPKPVGDPSTVARSRGPWQEASSLRDVHISPEYFAFQECSCTDTKLYRREEVLEAGVLRNLTCVRKELQEGDNHMVIILVPAVLLGVIIPFGLLTWFRYRMALAKVQINMKKRRGPPCAGQDVCLVLTDVEGSTELWEWNTEVTAVSIDIHDRTMRSLLSKFYGYEITTEGDAFLVAFHDPMDALGWCAAVQIHLLTSEWPRLLFQHHKAGMQTPLMSLKGCKLSPGVATGLVESLSILEQPGDQDPANPRALASEVDFCTLRGLDIIFRGLRVRMGAATGRPDDVRTHKLTMRTEYFGDVVRKVQAVSDVPHGGQIIMDEDTFKAVNGRMQELSSGLSEVVHPKKRRRGLGHFRLSPFQRNASSSDLDSFRKRASNPEQDQYLGPTMSMDLASPGSPSSIHAGTATPERPSVDGLGPLFKQQGKETEVERSHASVVAAEQSTCQPTEGFLVRVVDMGCHKLKGVDAPNNLVQILIPGLEERGRFFKPLTSQEQLSPGYFDAPAAQVVPLRMVGSGKHHAEIPKVTLVFCAISRYSDMVASCKAAAEECLLIYNDCVRRTLLAANGYECQEQEGNFMMAFANAGEALQWCLMVQEIMMEVEWTPRQLGLPGAEEVLDTSGDVIFRGPRVVMGIYEGKPVRVVPHTTTGRADYFGQLVNRAARFCHAAGQGGQVVASLDLVRDLVALWVPSAVHDGAQPFTATVSLDMHQRLWPVRHTLSVHVRLNTCQYTQSPLGTKQKRRASMEMPGIAARDRVGGAVEDGASLIGAARPNLPKYMDSFSVQRRAQQGQWVWTQAVHVESLGMFRFKGVSGVHSIVCVRTQRLVGRVFKQVLRKGKSERIQPGKGMVYCIRFAGEPHKGSAYCVDDGAGKSVQERAAPPRDLGRRREMGGGTGNLSSLPPPSSSLSCEALLESDGTLPNAASSTDYGGPGVTGA